MCHGDGDGDGAGGLQQLVQPGTVAGADDLVAVGDTKPHLALCRHLLEPERRAASPQQSTPAALSSSAATPRPAKASFKGDKARRNAGATPRPTPGLWRSGRPRQTRRRRVLVCLSSSAATPCPKRARRPLYCPPPQCLAPFPIPGLRRGRGRRRARGRARTAATAGAVVLCSGVLHPLQHLPRLAAPSPQKSVRRRRHRQSERNG